MSITQKLKSHLSPKLMIGTVPIKVNRRTENINLEFGALARNASFSILATMGKTSVLCTVTHSVEPLEYSGFVPLSVFFVSKGYAAKKIPQNFNRREGKPADQDTLISRMIDRALRPLFDKDQAYETQIQCTLMSYDESYSPVPISIIASSIATKLSGANVKLVSTSDVYLKEDTESDEISDALLFNLPYRDAKSAKMHLSVASTHDRIVMIEMESQEIATDKIKKALKLAQIEGQKTLKGMEEFIEKSMSHLSQYPVFGAQSLESDLKTNNYLEEINNKFHDKIEDLLRISNKYNKKKQNLILIKEITEEFNGCNPSLTQSDISLAVKKIKRDIFKEYILNKKTRLDGRKVDEVRQLSADIDVFENLHGSALFTRGGSQSFASVTIGYPQEEQNAEYLGHEDRCSFMVHYNFFPFSVGEISSLRAPNRREIGHGKLVYKALSRIVPCKSKFPCAIRVVCEILESDGSTSMAALVSASLALMSAGIQINEHVAGIAMGLVEDTESDQYAILSDISGEEDELGLMDLKIASTENFITAIQMDIKNHGITIDQLYEAIDQSRPGIQKILSKMNEAIDRPRKKMSSEAPRIETMKVDTSKLKDIIGAQGKTIKSICEQTKTKIDLSSSDGVITIAGISDEQIMAAKEKINNISIGPQYNKIYDGTIAKIASFGLLVTFCEGRKGLIHISSTEASTERELRDRFSECDSVKVVLYSVSDMNKYNLKFADSQKPMEEGCGPNSVKHSEEGEDESGAVNDDEYDDASAAYDNLSSQDASRSRQKFESRVFKNSIRQNSIRQSRYMNDDNAVSGKGSATNRKSRGPQRGGFKRVNTERGLEKSKDKDKQKQTSEGSKNNWFF